MLCIYMVGSPIHQRKFRLQSRQESHNLTASQWRSDSSKLRSVTSMAANRTSASSKSTTTQIDLNTTTTTTKTKTKRKSKPKPKPKSIQDESTRPQTPKKNQLNPSSSSSTPKRTKSPGVRVVGNRIYDSKNGKTCHQVPLHGSMQCVCLTVFPQKDPCFLGNLEIKICVLWSVSTENHGLFGDLHQPGR